MIKIQNIQKAYDQKQVLSIDRLHIKKKMITGIVGGNGCGKSTLLKIINQLEKEDSGTIEYDLDLDDMVYVFQKPHLFKTTVYKNIAMPLKFRNYKREIIDLEVSRMLKLFKIENLKDQNADKLSGGEAQKVNLARALVFKPKLLLLDEPTANIDPKSTQLIESVLKNLDMSIVLVTHNLAQAERLCDLVFVMEEGKIVFEGSASEAIRHKSLQYI